MFGEKMITAPEKVCICHVFHKANIVGPERARNDFSLMSNGVGFTTGSDFFCALEALVVRDRLKIYLKAIYLAHE